MINTDLLPLQQEEILREVVRAALDAVRPENFIPRTVHLEGTNLLIRDQQFDLSGFRHVYIAAIGKAAIGMAEATERIIGAFLTEGIALTKQIPQSAGLSSKWEILQGGHPVPTAESVVGANKILAMLGKAEKNDLVIFLISGGGSSLMTSPVDGISLQSYQEFCSAVLSCGADITEFNTLRKHLDAVKGGRLAIAAAPATHVTIILSDVVGSPLDIIASGPTVPDPSTFSDALSILERYSSKAAFPPEIRRTLVKGLNGQIPETLKPDHSLFERSHIFLAAENRTAAAAAAQKGSEYKLFSKVITTGLIGEAASIGKMLPSFLAELEAPGLMIFGGETTVSINGSGTGGRNQELALGAVQAMASYPGCVLVTLATDGEDGPTDAAGAVVTSETFQRAKDHGLTPEEYLHNNDSYHFFEKAGGLIKIGSTGTNVNDLTFLFRFK